MNWLKTISIICTAVALLAGLQYINLRALHKDRVDFYGWQIERSTEISEEDKKAELAVLKKEEIAINNGKRWAIRIFFTA